MKFKNQQTEGSNLLLDQKCLQNLACSNFKPDVEEHENEPERENIVSVKQFLKVGIW